MEAPVWRMFKLGGMTRARKTLSLRARTGITSEFVRHRMVLRFENELAEEMRDERFREALAVAPESRSGEQRKTIEKKLEKLDDIAASANESICLFGSYAKGMRGDLKRSLYILSPSATGMALITALAIPPVAALAPVFASPYIWAGLRRAGKGPVVRATEKAVSERWNPEMVRETRKGDGRAGQKHRKQAAVSGDGTRAQTPRQTRIILGPLLTGSAPPASASGCASK